MLPKGKGLDHDTFGVRNLSLYYGEYFEGVGDDIYIDRCGMKLTMNKKRDTEQDVFPIHQTPIISRVSRIIEYIIPTDKGNFEPHYCRSDKSPL